MLDYKLILLLDSIHFNSMSVLCYLMYSKLHYLVIMYNFMFLLIIHNSLLLHSMCNLYHTCIYILILFHYNSMYFSILLFNSLLHLREYFKYISLFLKYNLFNFIHHKSFFIILDISLHLLLYSYLLKSKIGFLHLLFIVENSFTLILFCFLFHLLSLLGKIYMLSFMFIILHMLEGNLLFHHLDL